MFKSDYGILDEKEDDELFANTFSIPKNTLSQKSKKSIQALPQEKSSKNTIKCNLPEELLTTLSNFKCKSKNKDSHVYSEQFMTKCVSNENKIAFDGEEAKNGLNHNFLHSPKMQQETSKTKEPMTDFVQEDIAFDVFFNEDDNDLLDTDDNDLFDADDNDLFDTDDNVLFDVDEPKGNDVKDKLPYGQVDKVPFMANHNLINEVKEIKCKSTFGNNKESITTQNMGLYVQNRLTSSIQTVRDVLFNDEDENLFNIKKDNYSKDKLPCLKDGKSALNKSVISEGKEINLTSINNEKNGLTLNSVLSVQGKHVIPNKALNDVFVDHADDDFLNDALFDNEDDKLPCQRYKKVAKDRLTCGTENKTSPAYNKGYARGDEEFNCSSVFISNEGSNLTQNASLSGENMMSTPIQPLADNFETLLSYSESVERIRIKQLRDINLLSDLSPINTEDGINGKETVNNALHYKNSTNSYTNNYDAFNTPPNSKDKHDPLYYTRQPILKDQRPLVNSPVTPVSKSYNNSVNTCRKRRFPGPAGLLPDLPRNADMSKICIQELLYSQDNIEDFNIPAWQNMVKELPKYIDVELSNFSIKSMRSKSSKKRLPKLIDLPIFCALLKTMSYNGKYAMGKFEDPTGEISGRIDIEVLKKHNNCIQPGCALVLRQASFVCCELVIPPSTISFVYDSNGKCVWATEIPFDCVPKKTVSNLAKSDISPLSDKNHNTKYSTTQKLSSLTKPNKDELFVDVMDELFQDIDENSFTDDIETWT